MREISLRPVRPPPLGPEARQPTAGPPKQPAERLPPPPVWATCQPKRRGAILAVDLGSDGRPCSSQEQKGRRRRRPQTLGHFFPPCSLHTAAAAAMATKDERVAAPPRLPRRRAHSPEGERAAVK